VLTPLDVHIIICMLRVDRLSLELPGRQPDLIKALARRSPELPLVVVLMHGGGLDVAWMQAVPQVKAILSVPFPGQVCMCGWQLEKCGGTPRGERGAAWWKSRGVWEGLGGLGGMSGGIRGGGWREWCAVRCRGLGTGQSHPVSALPWTGERGNLQLVKV